MTEPLVVPKKYNAPFIHYEVSYSSESHLVIYECATCKFVSCTCSQFLKKHFYSKNYVCKHHSLVSAHLAHFYPPGDKYNAFAKIWMDTISQAEIVAAQKAALDNPMKRINELQLDSNLNKSEARMEGPPGRKYHYWDELSSDEQQLFIEMGWDQVEEEDRGSIYGDIKEKYHLAGKVLKMSKLSNGKVAYKNEDSFDEDKRKYSREKSSRMDDRDYPKKDSYYSQPKLKPFGNFDHYDADNPFLEKPFFIKGSPEEDDNDEGDMYDE